MHIISIKQLDICGFARHLFPVDFHIQYREVLNEATSEIVLSNWYYTQLDISNSPNFEHNFTSLDEMKRQ